MRLFSRSSLAPVQLHSTEGFESSRRLYGFTYILPWCLGLFRPSFEGVLNRETVKSRILCIGKPSVNSSAPFSHGLVTFKFYSITLKYCFSTRLPDFGTKQKTLNLYGRCGHEVQSLNLETVRLLHVRPA